MDTNIEDLIARQSQVIATLALRISVLEKLLLNNKILTEADVIKETEVLGMEFAKKTQDALRKAMQSKDKA
jgi:hypothetical protein